jgi:hypothetical protein
MPRDLAAGIRMETNMYARKPCRTTAYISRPRGGAGKEERGEEDATRLLREKKNTQGQHSCATRKNAARLLRPIFPAFESHHRTSLLRRRWCPRHSSIRAMDRAWFVSFYSLQILHPYEVHMVVWSFSDDQVHQKQGNDTMKYA